MIGNQAASALEALQGVVEFLSLSVGKAFLVVPFSSGAGSFGDRLRY